MNYTFLYVLLIFAAIISPPLMYGAWREGRDRQRKP